MGNVPAHPTPAQAAELAERREELLARAALAIAQADVLLVTTGAGWSADSGLAVYRDVADLPAYRARELTYRELCTPQLQAEDAPLFMGFWGQCFNTYRNTAPHAGYALVAKWRAQRFSDSPAAKELQELMAAAEGGGGGGGGAAAEASSGGGAGVPGAFFSFTSNVDAHWHSACSAAEVYECHGNSEFWQCADGECARALAAASGEAAGGDAAAATAGGRWRAPPGFAVAVEPEGLLAPLGCAPAARAARAVGSRLPHDAAAFASNHPACPACGGAARPSILFFDDAAWVGWPEEAARWGRWRDAVLALAQRRAAAGGAPLAVAILEAGAGGNVTTVRRTSEGFAEGVAAAGGSAVLVRVNPELPLADRPSARALTLPIQARGLAAVRALDGLLAGGQAGHAWGSPLEGLQLLPTAAAASAAPWGGGEGSESDGSEGEGGPR
jgi:NAD-dependent SIR2 family protein deacetylase